MPDPPPPPPTQQMTSAYRTVFTVRRRKRKKVLWGKQRKNKEAIFNDKNKNANKAKFYGLPGSILNGTSHAILPPSPGVSNFEQSTSKPFLHFQAWPKPWQHVVALLDCCYTALLMAQSQYTHLLLVLVIPSCYWRWISMHSRYKQPYICDMKQGN